MSKIPNGPAKIIITQEGGYRLFRFVSFPAWLRSEFDKGANFQPGPINNESGALHYKGWTIYSRSHPAIGNTTFYCPGHNHKLDDLESPWNGSGATLRGIIRTINRFDKACSWRKMKRLVRKYQEKQSV